MSRAERHVLHPRVVVERHGRLRERERPLGVGHLAGREDPVLDPVGRRSDLLDRRADDVERRRQIRGRVLEHAGLGVEVERSAGSGEARGPLVDHDVAREHRRLGRKVVPRRIRRDLEVLVLDDDLFAPLPELVLHEVHRVLGVEPDLAALLGRLELDLEVGALVEARREGIGLLGDLRERRGRRNGQDGESRSKSRRESAARPVAGRRFTRPWSGRSRRPETRPPSWREPPRRSLPGRARRARGRRRPAGRRRRRGP